MAQFGKVGTSMGKVDNGGNFVIEYKELKIRIYVLGGLYEKDY